MLGWLEHGVDHSSPGSGANQQRSAGCLLGESRIGRNAGGCHRRDGHAG